MSETAAALTAPPERLAAIEAELAEAVRRLDAAGTLDGDGGTVLRDALEHVRLAHALAVERVDQELARGLAEALTEVAVALSTEAGAEARFDGVTLALEAARQLLARHLDGPALWRSRSPRELVLWLADVLEGISQAGLAELLGVSPKTVYRWQTGASAAGAGDEDRLRALAAVVAQLRRSLTPGGIVAWLRSPRAGRPSVQEELRSPELLPGLLEDAAALRGA